ncbi:MAG TPA: PUA domain-containing protein, partial [Devosia sp.]|nr:PUA domain-containing protein [Devosia sp.]
PEIHAITPAIEAMAGGAASHLSRGGMTTKVEAGKIATQAGTAMIIAKGTDSHPLQALAEGGRHTLFHPAHSRAQARKRWIMGTLTVAGTVQVDPGAARALQTGKSLLPVGVTKVSGEFGRGDAIGVNNPDGIEIARGLASLDSEEARLVMGKHSDTVLELLGAGNRAALIHRDNLVLVGTQEDSHEPS